ncbi:MAG: T9SS type A sorting domain-containing protein [Bacteroidales bacterium]|nr:T9SS type A sorting domain-containing protein [Bacteroidales bacterium]
MKKLLVSLIQRRLNTVSLMKKLSARYYIVLLLGFSLTYFNSSAQSDSAIININHLSDDMYLIEAFSQDSCLLAAYYFFGDTSDITIAPITGIPGMGNPFGDDLLEETIFLPEDDRGALPYDVCYNTTNDKYYLYGGRKLLVVDGESNEIEEGILVSETADNLRRVITPLLGCEERLLYIEESNRVFCSTEDGTLLVFDGASNDNVTSHNWPLDKFMIFSSLHYNVAAGIVFWVVDDYGSGAHKSYISLFNENGDYLSQTALDGDRITDISTNSGGNRLYVTVTTSLPPLSNSYSGKIITYKIVNNHLQFLHEDEVDYVPQGIVYVPAFGSNPELFFVGYYSYDDQLIHVYHGLTGHILQQNIENPSIEEIFLGCYNSQDQKVYYSGSKIVSLPGEQFELAERIVEIDPLTFTLENNMDISLINGPVFVSLLSNNGFLYSGSTDNFQIIDGDDFSVVGDATLNGAHSYRLAINNSQDLPIVYSANMIDGNCAVIDISNTNAPQISETFLAGSSSYSGCYNSIDNKVYFIQNGCEGYSSSTFNDNSVVAIIDGETDESLGFIPLGNNLIDCAYNYATNTVLVSCLNDDKIAVIDGATNEVNYISNIFEPEQIVSGPDEKVYCKGSVGPESYNGIYSINLNTNEIIQIFTPDIIRCMVHDGDHTLYACYGGYTGYIIAINTDTYQMSDPIEVYERPTDLKFDPVNNILFCINYSYVPWNSKLSIVTINGWNNYSVNNIDLDEPKSRCMEFRNKENSRKLYILGGEYLSIFSVDQMELLPGFPIVGHSILYNEFNDRLYLLLDHDDSDFESLILAYDCSNDDVCSGIYLDQRHKNSIVTVYPGSSDMNMVLNSTNNKLYNGNIFFSNVSVIQCAPETRALQPGWNWLSFPRLDRDNQTNYGVDAISLLENIDPFPSNLYIEHLIADFVYMTDLTYYNNEWYSNNLDSIYSDRGYKMMTDNPGESILPCPGTILTPDWVVDLYGPDKENWIGYFLTEPRWSEDAFAGVWDKLTMVKTQYWTMAKIFGQWFTDSKVGPLQYGDMVIVKCTEDCSFLWNVSAPPDTPKGYAATEYFTYEEQADYTPIYVELDTTDLPLEVGVFCDTVCYGAEVVNTGDTMVQINAYSDTTGLGGELEFAYHYALKRAHLKKSEYYIFNTITGRMEPGKIRKGDNKEWYWVSFKKEDAKDNQLVVTPDIKLQSVQPNPFNDRTYIKYSLYAVKDVSIRIINLHGQVVKVLLQGSQIEGTYTVQWDGTNLAGQETKQGVYLLLIETSEGVITEKLIRMK